MSSQLLTMLKISALPIALVLLLCPLSNAVAQDEAEHQALREKRAIYENAINSGDIKPLEPLFAAKASGVMITGDVINKFQEMENFNEAVKAYLGEGAKHHVTLKPERSEIYSDIALARGSSDESVTMHGKDFEYQSQWTAVFHKEEGQWKCVRLHISMNPFDNVFIDAKVNAAKWMSLVWGVLNLVAGTLLGYLLHGRKKAV